MNRPFTHLALLILLSTPFIISAGTISDVSVSPDSFNPSSGQSAAISLRVESAGRVVVEILDSSQNTVRVLDSQKARSKGVLTFSWDGHSDGGSVVDDGCYFVTIRHESPSGVNLYFPASGKQPPPERIKADYYDRPTGILSYTLPSPSTVRIQAGTVRRDSKSAAREPVISKTVVENAARTAGKVIQYFDGYDDDDVYLPGEPDFFVRIEATPLPESSIIIFGKPQTIRSGKTP